MCALQWPDIDWGSGDLCLRPAYITMAGGPAVVWLIHGMSGLNRERGGSDGPAFGDRYLPRVAYFLLVDS